MLLLKQSLTKGSSFLQTKHPQATSIKSSIKNNNNNNQITQNSTLNLLQSSLFLDYSLNLSHQRRWLATSPNVKQTLSAEDTWTKLFGDTPTPPQQSQAKQNNSQIPESYQNIPRSNSFGNDKKYGIRQQNFDTFREPVQPPPPAKNPFPNAPPTTGIDFSKYDSIPVEVRGPNPPKSIETFAELNLEQSIMKNIELAGYTRPVPVQKYSIPIALAGRDMMSCAQTGSGKTAAFVLPIVSKLLKNPLRVDRNERGGMKYPRALIIVPTRELAQQIAEEVRKFSWGTGLKGVAVYGGTPTGSQYRDLMNGVDILIGTPGRLMDFLERRTYSLAKIQVAVLDEADRMLDMGFEKDIRKIVQESDMPFVSERQMMMYSATFPKDIQLLAAQFLARDHLFVTVGRVGSPTEYIKQQFVHCEKGSERDNHIFDLLSKDLAGARVLVFSETKRDVDRLHWTLVTRGIKAASIHGDRSQSDRDIAMKTFSNGTTNVLIATNVASRGLDIKGVSHVINFDMPRDIDSYVHRIGRTGRAGKEGTAISYIGAEEAALIQELTDILIESKQEIPGWFQGLMSRGFSGGPRAQNSFRPPQRSGYSSNSYGGRNSGGYSGGRNSGGGRGGGDGGGYRESRNNQSSQWGSWDD